jgi:hypothetical protein
MRPISYAVDKGEFVGEMKAKKSKNPRAISSWVQLLMN